MTSNRYVFIGLHFLSCNKRNFSRSSTAGLLMVCGVKETPANSIKIKMVSVCVIEHKYGGEHSMAVEKKKESFPCYEVRIQFNSIFFKHGKIHHEYIQ